MPFRKKKTARDQIEDRLDDFLVQADDLRQQIADRAPGVRDQLIERLEKGVAEVRERWPDVRDDLLERLPEMSDDTYDKLPNGVAERLPDQVKPKKKRRLRKIAVVGVVTGAGAAAFAAVRRQQAPATHPVPPPFDTAPTPPTSTPGNHSAAPSTAGDVLDTEPGPTP